MDRRVRSISRRVWQWIEGRTLEAQVLAVFEQACSLVTSQGVVVTLVLPPIGDGPLNVVIDGEPGDFAVAKPGTPVHLTGSRLLVGEMAISLAKASVWEPRADWEQLRLCREKIGQQLALLQSIVLFQEPEGSLLALLTMAPSISDRTESGRVRTLGRTQRDLPRPLRQDLAPAFLTAARIGAEAVQIGWQGDTASLQEGAAQLAGLGTGLTPAGDDFLAGLMLWAWLAHATPLHLCHVIVEQAVPRTTFLSAALLRAAAQGECSAGWHRLLEAMAGSRKEQLVSAVGNVLSHGHTSGADTLAGFLWMASPWLAGQR